MKNDKESLNEWSNIYYKNHKKRYDHDLKLVNKYHENGKILEIGSAPYHFTNLLKLKSIPVTGIDIDPERFNCFINEQALNIIKCDIETEELPFPDNEFQMVIFNEVFEHLRINPINTLLKINKIIEKDGIMILSTPNLYSVNNLLRFIRGDGFDNPYEQFSKIEKIGHMGHVREYTVNQVKEFLKKTGFKSLKVEMISYNSFNKLYKPFNLLRKIIPGLHAYQVHVCKKDN